MFFVLFVLYKQKVSEINEVVEILFDWFCLLFFCGCVCICSCFSRVTEIAKPISISRASRFLFLFLLLLFLWLIKTEIVEKTMISQKITQS